MSEEELDDITLHEAVNDRDHSFDEDLSKMQWNHVKIMVLFVIGLVLSTVVIIGCFYPLGVYVGSGILYPQDKYVYYDYYESYPDRSDSIQCDIEDTREFHVDIDVNQYADRMDVINGLVIQLRNLTEDQLKDKDFSTHIYYKTVYSIDDCGFSFDEIISRVHFDEKTGDVIEDKTTIDLSQNFEHDKDKGLLVDFRANDVYKNEQKIERGKKIIVLLKIIF